jgi:hypothetical protein
VNQAQVEDLSYSAVPVSFFLMSKSAEAILEQFKTLAPEEQRRVCEWIREHTPSAPPLAIRRPIAEIAGKYHARPPADAKDHDRGFAEAAALGTLPDPA